MTGVTEKTLMMAIVSAGRGYVRAGRECLLEYQSGERKTTIDSLSIKLGSTGCGKVLTSEYQMAQGEAIEVPASRACRRSIVDNRSISGS